MAKFKKSFVPKARLIQILGEHLIKDATVGLMELVKNAYDADATGVEIEMSDIGSETAKITIRDNGSGMDDKTFLTKWMNPATGHKEIQKIARKRTVLGRLPLGEKGVGRFAAQQIGDRLKMVSKVKNAAEELVVEIDWKLFENHEKNLSDVEVEYTYAKAEHFSKEKSGTMLEITHLKSDWTESDVKRISNTLKRMKSPFKGANDFEVMLSFSGCPEEFEKYRNLELTDIIDKAHYKFFALVDGSGILDYEYDFNLPGSNSQHRKDTADLLKESGEFAAGEKLLCGGIAVHLCHYSKDKSVLQGSGLNAKDIAELCGVSVYRDGMRILPYGERGNDWLELDNRRIQETSRIGNDTIIGMVEINQSANSILKDKTNREGLIENEAYYQLRKLILAIINEFETEIKEDKPKKQKSKEKPDLEAEKAINSAQAVVGAVISDLEKSPDSGNRGKAEELRKVEAQLEDVRKRVNLASREFESTSKTLFNLAGTGLAAERFTHEFARLVSGANSSLDRLRTQLTPLKPKVKKEIDAIGATLEALRNDIRLLGPMFYIRKVAKEKELDIKEIIESTLLLQDNAISKAQVQPSVSGESFKIFMREGSCMQIFNNLIDNTVYWLSRKSEGDDRKLKIVLDPKTSSVYVSDSGPGVTSRHRDMIFEPFFSMKGEEGRGLGLYIVKEILDEKKWSIGLVEQDEYPGLLKGANFKIVFAEANE